MKYPHCALLAPIDKQGWHEEFLFSILEVPDLFSLLDSPKNRFYHSSDPLFKIRIVIRKVQIVRLKIKTLKVRFQHCLIVYSQTRNCFLVLSCYLAKYLSNPLFPSHENFSIYLRGCPKTMSSQNRRFLTPSPLLVVFLLSKIGNF